MAVEYWLAEDDVLNIAEEIIDAHHEFTTNDVITKRRALIDHELCHCEMSEDEIGNPVYKMRKHDLEEFSEVVRRHGAWRDGIQDLDDQLKLFEAESAGINPEELKPVLKRIV